MKKYLFVKLLVVTLLALVMSFAFGSAFAKVQNVSAKKSIVRNMPKNKHINAFRIDNIIGSGVINLEGKRIGTINDLVIDIDTGNIKYAALEFGGFMGFGDKLFAVPWQSLTAVPAEGIFIIDQSEKKLEKAPGFNKNNWPDINDKSWGAGIYEFYRHHLPFPVAAATPATPEKQQLQNSYETYPSYETQPYPYSSIWGDMYEKLFDPKKIESVTGEILKVEVHDGLRLIIYSDAKKPVLVALGSDEYFEGQEKLLRPGAKVTVTGSSVIVDDTPFLIVTKIKAGNEELQIRDAKGHPVWMSWQKIE